VNLALGIDRKSVVMTFKKERESNKRGRQAVVATVFTFYPQRNYYSSVAVIKSTDAETNL
jgi:hypothetical protein